MKRRGAMGSLNRTMRAFWPILFALAGFTPRSNYAQASGDGNVRNSPADASVAIRFFFQPPGDYFHVPLIFRVAGQKDQRLNTAPLLDAARTAYISPADMQRLLPAVAHLLCVVRMRSSRVQSECLPGARRATGFGMINQSVEARFFDCAARRRNREARFPGEKRRGPFRSE
jgi:hypothetical protein